MLCAPSLGGESFGMVLTEAFASGTPVVASDIAGYRDVVRDGVDGVLVPAGRRRAALGEALHALALDPERRARMAAAARERAERFAWPRVADEVMEAYEDAIETRRGREGRVARSSRAPGSAPAEAGAAWPPQRLPSIEPEAPARHAARAVRVARRGAVVGAAPSPASA